MFGFFFLNAWYGVSATRAPVPTRFIRYLECLIASPHNTFGTLMCLRMFLVIPRSVLFLLSTTLFCWGEYGAVRCLVILDASQYFWNSPEQNSPPRLVQNVFILAHISFSTTTLNFLKLSNASPLSLSKIVHI